MSPPWASVRGGMARPPALWACMLGARATHLCLIRGMLMQLAAATAAKGTNRPTRGGRCWEGRKDVTQWP